ncbi:MAG TPA: alpha/beta hydrolase [Thermoanaerobaculia bacterium]|jgi:proline iminopeptidase
MIVSVPGAELFYSTRGEGPTCLVLCGIGTKPYERMTPPPLSDRFRLVYVDLRGSGQSTGDPTALTFDLLAGDLEAVRADLGVERTAVLGYSVLSALAIEYGRRCPGSVSHVIMAGAPPRGDMAWLMAQATAFFEADAAEERKRILRDNLAALPAEASPGQAMLAQTPMRFFDPCFDAAPLFAEAAPGMLLQHVLGALTRNWDVTAGASGPRVPLFLAHGRYDYVVPYVLWDGIPAQLPDATLEIFPRSGHQPFFEEPDRFAAAVTAWMASRR